MDAGQSVTDGAPASPAGGPPDELQRRLVHASGAALPVAHLVGVLSWPQLRLLYVLGLGVAVVLEFVRLGLGREWRLFDRLARDYERSNPAGYALYVLSSTLVVLAFEPAIAVPAVLALTIVDPVSGLLADNEFPEPKRPAVLAVTFALTWVIATPFVSLPAALLAAAVVTLADGMTPVVRGHAIDDNLTIPIGAAVAMWVGLALPI